MELAGDSPLSSARGSRRENQKINLNPKRTICKDTHTITQLHTLIDLCYPLANLNYIFQIMKFRLDGLGSRG